MAISCKQLINKFPSKFTKCITLSCCIGRGHVHVILGPQDWGWQRHIWRRLSKVHSESKLDNIYSSQFTLRGISSVTHARIKIITFTRNITSTSPIFYSNMCHHFTRFLLYPTYPDIVLKLTKKMELSIRTKLQQTTKYFITKTIKYLSTSQIANGLLFATLHLPSMRIVIAALAWIMPPLKT